LRIVRQKRSRRWKQILIDNDDLKLSDALANEQRLFQSVANTPESDPDDARDQRRFDSGESIRNVYGLPRGSK